MPLTPMPQPGVLTPRRVSLKQRLGSICLAVLGMTIVSFTIMAVKAVHGAPAPRITEQLTYLLGGGGLAAMCLVRAWRGLQDSPDAPPPARLRRLCPGCGRMASADGPHGEACPRCGMPGTASAWVVAPGQRFSTAGQLITGLFMGCALSFSAHHWLRYFESTHRGRSPSLALLTTTVGLTGLIGVLVSVRDDWRARRRQRSRRFSPSHRASSLSLSAEAWVDEHDQLERAEGSSSWEITTSLLPVPLASLGADRSRVLRLLARLEWRKRIVVRRVRRLSWKRQRVETTAAVASSGYRGGSNEKAWVCTEQHAVEVRIDEAHDSGRRLAQRLGWTRGRTGTVDELVERLERDRSLFDAVARLGRRTGSQPDPDPGSLNQRIGELAVLTTR